MKQFLAEYNCGTVSLDQLSRKIVHKSRFKEVDAPQKDDIIIMKWGKCYYNHVGTFVDSNSFKHGGGDVPAHISKYYLYRKFDHKIVRWV